jgi:excinuclease ABC subunit A
MPVQTAVSPKNKDIIIKGARVHNLKNITTHIPRNKFVVITGLSGSGKSSLAFDTLYAEGQRRYVESLSSYARQFLGKLDKPEVDQIINISPAIAIEQKVISRNSRSTVGTTTEIYDYLKLLFARIGTTYSPISGREVKKHHVKDVVFSINELDEGTRFIILAPLSTKDKTLGQIAKTLQQQGFSRVKVGNEILSLEDLSHHTSSYDDLSIVVDRATVNKEDEDAQSRLSDSIQTAFYEGHGYCTIEYYDDKKNASKWDFSNKFELDGMLFEEPSTHFFSFNNPVGACKTCNGFGEVIGIDSNLVIPNKTLSIFEDAVVCWKGEKMQEWKHELINASTKFDFPIHRSISELTPEEYDLLWTGNEHFAGINGFFKFVEENAYKIQYRVLLSRYRGKTPCHDCQGTRLRKDATYVKINNKSISNLVNMPVDELLPFFNKLSITKNQQQIAKRLLIEINNRLGYLCKVGLGYLTLNRLSNTLSGGESQRINLSTSLGSSLVGSMYILDEPSIGLHPRDTVRLIEVIQSLKKLGNTVIVVEHDEEIMQAADHIIDMGPEAGRLGGEIVFEGNHEELLAASDSLTAKYLTNQLEISIPPIRRSWHDYILLTGASENNLQEVDVKFPLNCFTIVTGVSGSGKTSLIKHVLYPALKRHLGEASGKIGSHKTLEGDLQQLSAIELVDQNPIGKSSRSNPVTYVKAFDEIRALMSEMPISIQQGLRPSAFSFNVPGGRCDQCEGEGEITVEMQFIADVHLKCDSCHGQRYKQEVLDVLFDGKNIYDILCLTIDDAIDFFEKQTKNTTCQKIVKKLLPLQEVGLGYVQLGQSSSTLSGGEAQRIKLASFLSKGKSSGKTLFIFDEPTTGLHFHDIKKLLKAFNALIEQGNSVLVIEHHADMIKSADWVIDLGPDGGKNGGKIIFEGIPEDLIECSNSLTGQYLKQKFN